MRIFFLLFLSLCLSQQYYVDIPEETGASEMIIFEAIISSLDEGDEIGIFDLYGLLSHQDCSDEYGEILVGAGVWDGQQLDLVAVSSIDFCDIGGYQLQGFISENPIVIRVWDSSAEIEYATTAIFAEGSSSDFEEGFTIISEIFLEEALSITAIETPNFTLSSIYPNPFNAMVTIEIDITSPLNNFEIDIFDIRGQHIDNIFTVGPNFADKISLYWNASHVQSGVYLIRFKDESGSLTKKVTLLK